MAEGQSQYRTRLDAVFVNYAKTVVALRWPIVLIVLALMAQLISGARFLEFTTDYRYFFSSQNPELDAFDKLERTYTSPDTVIWAIQPAQGQVTDPQVLAVIGKLTQDAWQTPFSVRVDSITNFQHTTADGDDLVVRDLVPDPANTSPQDAEAAREVAVHEPALVNRAISPDARTTAVIATLRLPKGDTKAVSEAVAFARALKADIEAAHPELHVALTGSTPLANAFAEASQGDLQTLFPGMFLIIAVVLILLTRSISGSVSALIAVLLAALSSMGLAGWQGILISSPSAAAPTLILTVAVADSIHILITMLMEMRRGREQRAAIIESLRINFTPVFLTSLTTAIGFLTLNFADAPPLRDMGNMTAFGAVMAWVLSVTLFPALLAILPVRARPFIEGQSALMTRFAEVVIRTRYIWMLAIVVLVAFSATQIPKLRFNDRPVEYFDHRIEFRSDADWTAENLTGIYQVNWSMESGESGGVADPDYLRELETFANWLRAQPEVTHVATLTDVMKRLNKSMHGDDPAHYRVPEGRELSAQYLLLYEMSLPYGLDLNDQINVDKSATRVTATLINHMASEDLRAFVNRADAWLAENVRASMRERPAGQFMMFSFIGRNNFDKMRAGVLTAVVVISALLMLALRSLRLGFISLIPNLTPPLIAFGLYALFYDIIGFWAAFIVPTALGLIVDDTVHFLSKYQRARRERGQTPVDAVRYAFTTVGTALWVTTLVLMAGFGLLAFSYFQVTAYMGIMVSLTIAIALAGDFLLLPGLLILLDRRRMAAGPALAAAPAE